MKNFICDGDRIAIVASSEVASGDLVLIGSKVVVAITGAKSGDTFTAMTEGVFECPKSTETIAQGDALYYDAANKKLTKTATNNTPAGWAYQAAKSAETTVPLFLRC